jgi:hypothetical protein
VLNFHVFPMGIRPRETICAQCTVIWSGLKYLHARSLSNRDDPFLWMLRHLKKGSSVHGPKGNASCSGSPPVYRMQINARHVPNLWSVEAHLGWSHARSMPGLPEKQDKSMLCFIKILKIIGKRFFKTTKIYLYIWLSSVEINYWKKHPLIRSICRELC